MHLPEFLDLGAGFQKFFRVRPALDDTTRREVFRIRHTVYCEELGYEPVRDDGLESDEFDRRSLHCVLQAIATGEYIGCVRLVLAERGRLDVELPFETRCGSTLDRTIIDPAQLDRSRIAEVSRLAVIARYRRRRGERDVPIRIDEGDFGSPDRPRFPYIAAGLYLAMLAQAKRHDIDTLFMLTERTLGKQLTRLGVALRPIGPPIEHRGLRYPSVMSVQEVIDGFSVFVRPLFAVIAGEINDAYQRHEQRVAV
jgi:N-acyl amino acid synthase of PEP-CTERM/exosortase system